MAGFYPFGYDVTIIAKVLIDMSIERKLRSQYFKINNCYLQDGKFDRSCFFYAT